MVERLQVNSMTLYFTNHAQTETTTEAQTSHSIAATIFNSLFTNHLVRPSITSPEQHEEVIQQLQEILERNNQQQQSYSISYQQLLACNILSNQALQSDVIASLTNEQSKTHYDCSVVMDEFDSAPGMSFANRLLAADIDSDQHVSALEMSKELPHLSALAHDGQGVDTAEQFLVEIIEDSYDNDQTISWHMQDDRVILSFQSSSQGPTSISIPHIRSEDQPSIHTQELHNRGITLSHGTDAGNYFCEHMFYYCQQFASLPDSSVEQNHCGENLVGFLHVPADDFSSHTNLNQQAYIQAERHNATRSVISSAIKGYYHDLASRNPDSNTAKHILITGYGPFADIKNNPTGDFVTHQENIDACMWLAFGEHLLTPQGTPVSLANTDNSVSMRQWEYTIFDPELGCEQTIIISGAMFPVVDEAIDQLGSTSIQAVLADVQPQAVISMGAGTGHYLVEYKADKGGLRLEQGREVDGNGGQTSLRLRDNFSLARAIDNGVTTIDWTANVITANESNGINDVASQTMSDTLSISSIANRSIEFSEAQAFIYEGDRRIECSIAEALATLYHWSVDDTDLLTNIVANNQTQQFCKFLTQQYETLITQQQTSGLQAAIQQQARVAILHFYANIAIPYLEQDDTEHAQQIITAFIQLSQREPENRIRKFIYDVINRNEQLKSLPEVRQLAQQIYPIRPNPDWLADGKFDMVIYIDNNMVTIDNVVPWLKRYFQENLHIDEITEDTFSVTSYPEGHDFYCTVNAQIPGIDGAPSIPVSISVANPNKTVNLAKINDDHYDFHTTFGHSGFGRDSLARLEEAPRASADGVGIMSVECYGAGKSSNYHERFNRLEYITTTNMSVNDQAFYDLWTLVKGVCWGWDYEQIRNEWVHTQTHFTYRTEYISPDQREIITQKIDYDHDGIPLSEDTYFNAIQVQVHGNLGGFVPAIHNEPTYRLPGRALGQAVDDLCRLFEYSQYFTPEESNGWDIDGRLFVPGGYFEPTVEESNQPFRFTVDETVPNGQVIIQLNSSFAHGTVRKLGKLLAIETARFLSEHCNLNPDKARGLQLALLLKEFEQHEPSYEPITSILDEPEVEFQLLCQRYGWPSSLSFQELYNLMFEVQNIYHLEDFTPEVLTHFCEQVVNVAPALDTEPQPFGNVVVPVTAYEYERQAFLNIRTNSNITDIQTQIRRMLNNDNVIIEGYYSEPYDQMAHGADFTSTYNFLSGNGGCCFHVGACLITEDTVFRCQLNGEQFLLIPDQEQGYGYIKLDINLQSSLLHATNFVPINQSNTALSSLLPDDSSQLSSSYANISEAMKTLNKNLEQLQPELEQYGISLSLPISSGDFQAAQEPGSMFTFEQTMDHNTPSLCIHIDEQFSGLRIRHQYRQLCFELARYLSSETNLSEHQQQALGLLLQNSNRIVPYFDTIEFYLLDQIVNMQSGLFLDPSLSQLESKQGFTLEEITTILEEHNSFCDPTEQDPLHVIDSLIGHSLSGSNKKQLVNNLQQLLQTTPQFKDCNIIAFDSRLGDSPYAAKSSVQSYTVVIETPNQNIFPLVISINEENAQNTIIQAIQIDIPHIKNLIGHFIASSALLPMQNTTYPLGQLWGILPNKNTALPAYELEIPIRSDIVNSLQLGMYLPQQYDILKAVNFNVLGWSDPDPTSPFQFSFEVDEEHPDQVNISVNPSYPHDTKSNPYGHNVNVIPACFAIEYALFLSKHLSLNQQQTFDICAELLRKYPLPEPHASFILERYGFPNNFTYSWVKSGHATNTKYSFAIETSAQMQERRDYRLSTYDAADPNWQLNEPQVQFLRPLTELTNVYFDYNSDWLNQLQTTIESTLGIYDTSLTRATIIVGTEKTPQDTLWITITDSDGHDINILSSFSRNNQGQIILGEFHQINCTRNISDPLRPIDLLGRDPLTFINGAAHETYNAQLDIAETCTIVELVFNDFKSRIPIAGIDPEIELSLVPAGVFTPTDNQNNMFAFHFHEPTTTDRAQRLTVDVAINEHFLTSTSIDPTAYSLLAIELGLAYTKHLGISEDLQTKATIELLLMLFSISNANSFGYSPLPSNSEFNRLMLLELIKQRYPCLDDLSFMMLTEADSYSVNSEAVIQAKCDIQASADTSIIARVGDPIVIADLDPFENPANLQIQTEHQRLAAQVHALQGYESCTILYTTEWENQHVAAVQTQAGDYQLIVLQASPFINQYSATAINLSLQSPLLQTMLEETIAPDGENDSFVQQCYNPMKSNLPLQASDENHYRWYDYLFNISSTMFPVVNQSAYVSMTDFGFLASYGIDKLVATGTFIPESNQYDAFQFEIVEENGQRNINIKINAHYLGISGRYFHKPLLGFELGRYLGGALQLEQKEAYALALFGMLSGIGSTDIIGRLTILQQRYGIDPQLISTLYEFQSSIQDNTQDIDLQQFIELFDPQQLNSTEFSDPQIVGQNYQWNIANHSSLFSDDPYSYFVPPTINGEAVASLLQEQEALSEYIIDSINGLRTHHYGYSFTVTVLNEKGEKQFITVHTNISGEPTSASMILDDHT